MARYNSNMSLQEIMADREMKAIVLKHMPKIESNPMLTMAKGHTLSQIKNRLNAKQQERISIILKELNDLK